jgi:chaperonin GroEL
MRSTQRVAVEEGIVPGGGTALQDAATVAGLLITTEAAISDAPDHFAGGAGGMPSGMGGMGDMDS